MSEIREYRGKDIYTGKWVYGDVIQYEDGSMSILHKKFSKQGYEATEIINRAFVDPKTVGQWTGLFEDSMTTGITVNKIYDGDIVNGVYSDLQGEPHTFKNVVVDSLNYAIMLSLDTCNQLEIVGNIHDNPELLEVEK